MEKTKQKNLRCALNGVSFFLHVDISITKLIPLRNHVPRCSYIMAFTGFFFFYNQSLRIKEKKRGEDVINVIRNLITLRREKLCSTSM